MTKVKSKSKKEYIFIREKYKKNKSLFDEWEKYDSISKRILCYSGKYSYCEVEYIRIKEEDDIIVISFIEEKINRTLVPPKNRRYEPTVEATSFI